MDEFQFKPLTEGLGFHKKTSNRGPRFQAKPEPQDSSTGSTSTDSLIEEAFDLTPALPRPERPTPKSIQPSPEANSTVDEILKTLNSTRQLDFKDSSLKTGTQAKKQAQVRFINTTVELSAGLLDAMLVVAISLLGMIITLVTTKVDLAANLMNPDSESMVYFAVLALVAGMSWIYLTLTRAFMGFTPGEWVFDQRLGTPEEMQSLSYLPKLALRGLLVIATGFVTLPILSAIFGSDLAGSVSGLRLKKTVQG